MKYKILLFGLIFILMASFVDATLNDGLNYYAFDDAGVDSIGIDYDIVGAMGTTGKIDGAYSFVTDDYLQIPHNANQNEHLMTLSFWFKQDNSDNSLWLTKGTGYNTFYVGWYLNNLEFYQANSACNSWDTYIAYAHSQDSSWHYLAVQNDGSVAKMWIDGINVANDSSPTTSTCEELTPIHVATQGDAIGNFFDGDIDDIRIYNTSLSNSQIAGLYNSGSGTEDENIDSANLLLHLTMESAMDSVGSDNITFTTGGIEDRGILSTSTKYTGTDETGLGDITSLDSCVWTVSAWVNKTMAGGGAILGKWGAGDTIDFEITPTEFCSIAFKQAGGVDPTSPATDYAIPLNKWVHVVGVANGSVVTCWVNGTQTNMASSYDGTCQTGVDTAYIGARSTGAQNWQGNIDEIAIWNRALTSSEIQELYNNGLGYNPYTSSVTSSVDLLFSNLTDSTNYKSTFYQFETFNLFANYTLSNGTIINNSLGECYFNVDNGSITRINATFNNSLDLFVSDKSVNFFDVGTVNITGICVYNSDNSLNNTKIESVTINNILPVISFSGVNTSLGFVNVSTPFLIEYTNSPMQWIVNVTDYHTVSLNVTWYNSSNHVIQQNNSLTINDVIETDKDLFNEFVNIYNFSVVVNDGYDTVYYSTLFNITDTVNPTHNFTNVTQTNGTTFNFNYLIEDEYLWEVNLNCSAGLGYFNFSKTSIGATSYNLINSTSLTASSVCSFNISDGHTAKLIPDLKISKKINSFTVGDLTIGVQGMDDITFEKKPDRYSYTITKPKFTKELIFTLPNYCVYAENSKYRGHFVCGKYWFDVEGEDGKLTIDKTNKIVRINVKGKKMAKFNSIGLLNTVSGSFTVTAITPYSDTIPIEWSKDFDVNTTPGVLTLFFYVFLCFAVLIMGVLLRIPLIIILSGFLWFILGFILSFSLSIIFGFSICVLGTIIIFTGSALVLK